MSRKSREAIKSNLEKALAAPKSRRSSNLNELLNEYAPPEKTVTSQTSVLEVSPQSIPQRGIPQRGVPLQSIPRDKPLVDPSNGYYPTFNDISDNLIPTLKLDAFEQTVLLRLYRLSRGWKSQDCEVGYGGLVRQCNISRSKAQEAVASLIERGLLQNLGKARGNNGTCYRVLPEVPAIPSQTIPQDTILSGGQSVLQHNTPETPGIPPRGSIKHTDKDTKNTHTADVCVFSRFSFQECRRYADSLKSEGIQNPGGYATKIHRTGEADELVEQFLSPTAPVAAVDTRECPDCKGSGFWEPGGAGKGVAKCRHERLPQG